MPSTSPMPPKNLAAVRTSDRSTETRRKPPTPLDGQRRLEAALAGPGTPSGSRRSNASSAGFATARHPRQADHAARVLDPGRSRSGLGSGAMLVAATKQDGRGSSEHGGELHRLARESTRLRPRGGAMETRPSPRGRGSALLGSPRACSRVRRNAIGGTGDHGLSADAFLAGWH